MSLFFMSCSTTSKVSLLEQAKTHSKGIGNIGALVEIRDSNFSFICSGFVISNNEAITSAHCMKLYNENFVRITSDDTMVVGRFAAFNNKTDTALINGDFSSFRKFQIETDPQKDIIMSQENAQLINCGAPWGGEPTCYNVSNLQINKLKVKANYGSMHPGMSGGPVINLNTGKVVGINSAMGDGYIVFSPLTNFYDSLTEIPYGL